MVPFGTAAIETGGWAAGIGDARLAQSFVQRGDATFRDERVCAGVADGVAVICEQPGGAADAVDAVADTAVAVEATEAVVDAAIAAADATAAAAGEYEDQMRAGLSSVSWSKVGVGFRGASTLLPLAHNKLPALRRPGWRRVFEAIEQAHEGRELMDHCARYILDGLDGRAVEA